jgi:predicted AAA+ superfamily ATPase
MITVITMIKRENYLKRLLSYKDAKIIKVITGMRRSGKSTLLRQYRLELIRLGVQLSHIIEMNFESFEFVEIVNERTLYDWILTKMNDELTYYVLLDEIQQVIGWEKAVNALMVDRKVDLVITGSNAYLLSSELSTYLAGRYIEIPILPFSFREFIQSQAAAPQRTNGEYFDQYLKYGSLPMVAEFLPNEDLVYSYLRDIYHTILLKDIIQRNIIRDVSLLDTIARFLMDNIGNRLSTTKINQHFKADNRSSSVDTVISYLKMIETSYFAHRVMRFDIQGKEILKTQQKYYITDWGIRNVILGFRDRDYGHLLENIVYLELLRRGFDVMIGQSTLGEIDFIASRFDRIVYYQVVWSISDQSVYDREFEPLERLDNHHKKTVLVLNPASLTGRNGINLQSVIDFLLEPDN